MTAGGRVSESATYGAADAALLLLGLKKLNSPPTGATTGRSYWYTTEGRRRPTVWNLDWFTGPWRHWSAVPYREALVADLAAAAAGTVPTLVALSDPLLTSIDVFDPVLYPGMGQASETVRRLVLDDDGQYRRRLSSALTLGLSRHVGADGTGVVVLGVGLRRSTRVWSNTDVEPPDALRVDAELYVPFLVIGDDTAPVATEARALCAGLAVTRGGSSIGTVNGTDLSGLRANLRVPFTIDRSDGTFGTRFGAMTARVQTRAMRATDWTPATGDWRRLVGDLVESADGAALLDAPLGVAAVEKLSVASISDIVKGANVADELNRDSAALKETIGLLRGLMDGDLPPEVDRPDRTDPRIRTFSERTLGSLLETLGLRTDQGTLAVAVNGWDVLGGALDELDGFPLWVRKTTPGAVDQSRGMVGFASRRDPSDPSQYHFGVVGTAYDIPLARTPDGRVTASVPVADDSTAKVDQNAEKPDNHKPDKLESDKLESVNNETDNNESTGTTSPPSAPAPPSPPPSPPPSLPTNPPATPPATPPAEAADGGAAAPSYSLRLHLGKWMTGETLDDNWLRRLLPPVEGRDGIARRPRAGIPGFRVLPLAVTGVDTDVPGRARLSSLSPHLDLLSFGVDVIGSKERGLVLPGTDGLSGVSQLRVGSLEIRGSLQAGARFAERREDLATRYLTWGVGVMLGGIRLSLAPPPAGSGVAAVALADLGAASAPTTAGPKPSEKREADRRELRTGLAPTEDDGTFGLSVGYLNPTAGERGTFDVQLYDAEGKRGEVVVIPVDRRAGFLYLGSIGVALVGLEGGLTKDTKLTLAVTGGVRLAMLELGLIGAKLVIPLTHPKDVDWGLDGLDVSAKVGGLTVSGSFLKSKGEFMGHVTVEAPRFSFAAMGAIGRIPAENNQPQALTCFLFGSLSAAGDGAGIPFGPIVLTGLAFGGGFNRRVVVPAPERITEFPFVKMVMGEGGFQKDELGSGLVDQLGRPAKDPSKVLTAMGQSVPAERGQYFLCAGVRFTIAEVADCFGLLVAQFGKTLEFALVGLARMRQPRDPAARPLCYVEMQVLATFNPREGRVALFAVLSRNSWVIDPACRLSGGFAVHVWLGDQHHGDFVLTVGGYHPRFARPAHYPVVPRLALVWQVSESLTITGSAYLAVTSSCVMVGARLEIALYTSRVRVWATAALDAIVSWSPLFFEVDVFIGVRFEVDLWIKTFSSSLSAKIAMWGGPFGGRAELTLGPITVPISFGAPREQAKKLASWSEFVDSFLPSTKTPTPIPAGTPATGSATGPSAAAPTVVRPSLAAGRATPPTPARAGADTAGPPEDRWLVRGDQLVLAASTVVPATEMRVGTVATNSPPQGVGDLAVAGTPQMASGPVVLTGDPRVHASEKPLAVRPMDASLSSVLTVTVVRDVDGAAVPVELAGWALDEERSALPSALWEPGETGLTTPSASQVPGCVTGVRRLAPPRGGWAGDRVEVDLGGHRSLEARNLPRAAGQQPAPGAPPTVRVGRVLDASRAARERTVEALARAGFALGVDRTVCDFRAMRGQPMFEPEATPRVEPRVEVVV